MNTENHPINQEMAKETETVVNCIKFENVIIKEEDGHQEVAGVNFMYCNEVCESKSEVLPCPTSELGQCSGKFKEEIPDEENISATSLMQSSIEREDLSMCNRLLNKVIKQDINHQKGEASNSIVRPTTCKEYEKLGVCEESQLKVVSSHDHHITISDLNMMQTDHESVFPFSNSGQLKVITSKRSFTCNVCKKSFSQSSHLTQHERIHSGETPFTCNFCYKTFSRSFTLMIHKRTHSGETPFTCSICNKSFSHSSSLTVHKRTHSGETPFTCNICYKSFSHSCTLTRHKTTHSGETPFTCNICYKSFSKSFSLTTHKRIHSGETPYTCSICSKRFSQSSHLTTHKRIHTGETPFSCNICYKSFYSSSTLATHKRIHSGETPFSCNICYKSFSKSSNLKRHKKIHT